MVSLIGLYGLYAHNFNSKIILPLGEHFKGNQYMDGTPYVTQCPITPGSKYL